MKIQARWRGYSARKEFARRKKEAGEFARRKKEALDAIVQYYKTLIHDLSGSGGGKGSLPEIPQDYTTNLLSPRGGKLSRGSKFRLDERVSGNPRAALEIRSGKDQTGIQGF